MPGTAALRATALAARRPGAPSQPRAKVPVSAGFMRARRETAARQAGLVIPLSEWIGHNRGPDMLRASRGLVLQWAKARVEAFAPASPDIARQRAARAAALGISYEAYVLEILERGRYL